MPESTNHHPFPSTETLAVHATILAVMQARGALGTARDRLSRVDVDEARELVAYLNEIRDSLHSFMYASHQLAQVLRLEEAH